MYIYIKHIFIVGYIEYTAQMDNNILDNCENYDRQIPARNYTYVQTINCVFLWDSLEPSPALASHDFY